MDKFSIYNDIESRIQNCNELTKTPEGKFLAGIVLQRVKDAMGMLDADVTRVYLPHDGKAWVERRYVKRKTATHQEIAIQWFRDEQHFPWCDMLDIKPTWINHLLKTKAGVQL